MKQFIILALFALVMFTCKKSEFNDLAGNQVLKGVVVIHDTLHGINNIFPAKNFKVYIKNATGGNGFLYSTNADLQGKFSFSGIDSARSYIIYSSSDTGQVKYYGENLYTAGTYTADQPDSLKLYPSLTNQNGIHLISTNEQMQRIPGITTWVFNNASLFMADSSAGKIFDIQTNLYGVGNRFNIPPGTYFLRAKARIGNLDLAGEDTVIVPATGIVNANIVLRTVPLPRNGIEAIITDKYDTRVSNARVYAYRSQLLFESDTVSYGNSLFTMISNNEGIASTYMITPGTYFLRAVRVINSDTLTKTQVISVSANAVTQAPIKLE